VSFTLEDVSSLSNCDREDKIVRKNRPLGDGGDFM